MFLLAISNQQSAIRNKQSAIRNPQSSSVHHSTPLVAPCHHAVVPVCRVEAGGARALDGGRAAVVDEERQLQVAVVFIDQCPKVPEADAKVGLAIVELLPGDALLEEAGGGRHQLR